MNNDFEVGVCGCWSGLLHTCRVLIYFLFSQFAANNLDTPTIPDQLPPVEESTDIFPSLGHTPKTLTATSPAKTDKPTKRSLPNSPPMLLSEKQPSIQSHLESHGPHKRLAVDISCDHVVIESEDDIIRKEEEAMCVEESVVPVDGTEEDLLMEIFSD